MLDAAGLVRMRTGSSVRRSARGLGEICGTPITAMRLRGVMHRHALHGVERHGFPVEMDIGPMHRFRVAPVIGEDLSLIHI